MSGTNPSGKEGRNTGTGCALPSVTQENYFSHEIQRAYMSVSQFKAFRTCEACALAEIRGEWQRPETPALLVGSCVDAHFSGTLEAFREQHPNIFTKAGELKAEYRQAERIIARIERDPMMTKYLTGEKQVIMTGEIANVTFKIKADALHPGKALVDLKVMRDFQSVWDSDARQRIPWWRAWGYDFQAAVYQEIERQNRGADAAPLPFYLVAATKEPEPDILVGQFPQERLDACLDTVRKLAPRFAALKCGEGQPDRCGRCDYCRGTKVITEIELLTEDT